MSPRQTNSGTATPRGFLRRLARDKSGNTIALLAAAIFPLLAMIGGGIDIGIAYSAESRLQQACDAGVLAARKRLGSDLPPSDQVVGKVSLVGHKFFDLNFPDGRYDTKKRKFDMTLENDYSISGVASVELPTMVMRVFGYDKMPISVTCQARMNFTNLDIMMALDVTGSMRLTNPDDTSPRIDEMRNVIVKFYDNIETSKAPDTRIRYGFVPYATNVNVGGLLDDDWVVDEWTYQSREDAPDYVFTSPGFSNLDWKEVSGSYIDWTTDYTYQTSDGACNEPLPADTYTYDSTILSSETTPYAGPPAGTQTHTYYEVLENGVLYAVEFNGSECEVTKKEFDNYKRTYTKWTRPYTFTYSQWTYKPVTKDVSKWRTETIGCMEERASTQIADYTNVDLTQNLDLDINLVPSKGDPDTQWRPMYPNDIYARRMYNTESGTFDVTEYVSFAAYLRSGVQWYSACPAEAQKLAELTKTDLETYLSGLTPFGATYHDNGMIWAGRLLSQNGIFASENADISGNKPTSRHLIFLTDGQTEPYDVAYGAYGVEPLDQRRWDPTSPFTLYETVEKRFSFACNEVKKNNTTVWVIAFGTDLNPAMQECAGPGRYFEADDAAQLQEAFNNIAKSMGDLRVSA